MGVGERLSALALTLVPNWNLVPRAKVSCFKNTTQLLDYLSFLLEKRKEMWEEEKEEL